jgi:transposase InsO family protein
VQIYDGSHQTYGAVRIHDELRDEHQIRVGRKRVARLMRQRGIKGIPGQGRTRRTTIADKTTPPVPDLVERRFQAEAPNRLWLADITYVPTLEGWLFLGLVMDAFSRKIVGWSMRDDLKAELVVDALAMAVTRRRPPAGLVHHSDRARNTPLWRSAARSASRRWSPRWARAAMPTTTPPARAASRRSSASGSSGTATKAATRRGSRSSSSSRPSTTRADATPHSAASARTSTRDVFRTEDKKERLIQ